MSAEEQMSAAEDSSQTQRFGGKDYLDQFSRNSDPE